MSNVNVQGDVPLSGSGFVAKAKGNFQPGEYKSLHNVEINEEGYLQNRRNITLTGSETGGSITMTSPHGYVGMLGEYAIVSSKTTQWAASALKNYTMWAPTSLAMPAVPGTNSWHKIVHVFEYDRKWYWLTHQYDGPADTSRYFIHYRNAPFNRTPDAAITFASLTTVELFSTSGCPAVVAAFTFKDRLWFATEQTVYFSKATDPTVFAVPDGGFFGVTDTRIRHAFYSGDSVYVLCDESIYVYNYSIDPNEDAYLRPISTSVGGLWGCSHKNEPTIINKSGIWNISGGYFTQLHDNEFDIGYKDYNYKIESFEQYLVVLRYSWLNYNSKTIDSPEPNLWKFNNGPVFGLKQYNVVDASVFMLNTNNGAVHVVDFTDLNDGANKGYISDILPNPNLNFFGSHHLHFLCNHFEAFGGSEYLYEANAYVMEAQANNPFIADSVRIDNGERRNYHPKIKIEIESFSPDGNEFLMKKFRNLLFMGKMPATYLEVSVAYDNQPYKLGTQVQNENFANNRGHYPTRVPLNQRARSISIKFENTYAGSRETSYIWDQFQLSELKILWTYTQRLTARKNQTLSNSGKDY